MTQTRIYLVGFMGAGKSTIGRLLAKRLGWKFVDLDREIERAEGRAISEIFQCSGEPEFRRLEREHLDRISKRQHLVVALGGGAFVDDANRALAEDSGLTIWLKVSFATVRSRVRMDGSRPRFSDAVQAEQLYRSREPIYQLARIHVEVDERSPAAIVDELTGVIRRP